MIPNLLHIDAHALVIAERWGFAIIGGVDGYERRLLGHAHSLEAAIVAADAHAEMAPAVYEWIDVRWRRVR
jgi:hypothetical protein